MSRKTVAGVGLVIAGTVIGGELIHSYHRVTDMPNQFSGQFVRCNQSSPSKPVLEYLSCNHFKTAFECGPEREVVVPGRACDALRRVQSGEQFVLRSGDWNAKLIDYKGR